MTMQTQNGDVSKKRLDISRNDRVTAISTMEKNKINIAGFLIHWAPKELLKSVGQIDLPA